MSPCTRRAWALKGSTALPGPRDLQDALAGQGRQARLELVPQVPQDPLDLQDTPVLQALQVAQVRPGHWGQGRRDQLAQQAHLAQRALQVTPDAQGPLVLLVCLGRTG